MKKNTNVVVVFLGCDGSGKSTVINALKQELLARDIHLNYFHMRPGWLPSLGQLANRDVSATEISNPHSRKSFGRISSLIRFSYYWVDYVLGYQLKIRHLLSKGEIVIFDRYYYDYLIDPKRSRLNIPVWFFRWCGYFISSPDLVFCLGADPQTIFRRKPELELAEIERQIVALHHFCHNCPYAHWIDTGCDREETLQHVLRILFSSVDRKYNE